MFLKVLIFTGKKEETILGEIFSTFLDNLQILKFTDVLDIIIVAFCIYSVIKFVRETRAVNLIKGIVLIFVITQLSGWLNLNSINFILESTLQVGLIAIIIVFQPELRRALEKMGNSNISRIISDNDTEGMTYADDIIEAVYNLSHRKTGALIVLERETKLSDIMGSGIKMDAAVTRELIENIFVPNTPLHDGAVIISDDKIKAAACVLPLSNTTEIASGYGTRHRAAIGVSEVADCIAIVVSEETGKVSVAENGVLNSDLSESELKNILSFTANNNTSYVKTTKEKLLDWLVNKK